MQIVKNDGKGRQAPKSKSPKRARESCDEFHRVVTQKMEKVAWIVERVYKVKLKSLPNLDPDCQKAMITVKNWYSKTLPISVKRLGRRERISFRATMAGVKKVLPEPCKCMKTSNEKKFRENLATPLVPSPQYLSFVVREVKKMFPLGWDSEYEGQCVVNCKGRNACTEASRRQGGAMTMEDTYDELLDKTIFNNSDANIDMIMKYTEVLSAGKMRCLVKTSSSFNLLRPLHKTIYNHISRLPFLLRGDPTPSKFVKAGFVPGATYLSADYVGATDNLSVEVSEAILNTILDRSRSVPLSIRSCAERSLRPIIRFENGPDQVVQRGQMMGSLLSFPLLCIQNRLAALYSLGDVPMLINGDDLVAQIKDKRASQKFFDLLPSLGLQPEPTKTHVSSTSLNINSTEFIVTKRGVERVSHLRLKAMFPDPKIIPTNIGRIHGSLLEGHYGPRRQLVSEAFFEMRKNEIAALGRPLVDLGFRGSTALSSALKRSLVRTDLAFASSTTHRLEQTPPSPSNTLPTVEIRKNRLNRDINMLARVAYARHRQAESAEVIQKEAKDVWTEYKASNPTMHAMNLARKIKLKTGLMNSFNKMYKYKNTKTNRYYEFLGLSRQECMEKEKEKWKKKEKNDYVGVPLEVLPFIGVMKVRFTLSEDPKVHQIK